MGHDGLELPGEVAVTNSPEGAGEVAVEDDFVAGTGFESALECEAEDVGFGLEAEGPLGDGFGLTLAGDADGFGAEQVDVDGRREGRFDLRGAGVGGRSFGTLAQELGGDGPEGPAEITSFLHSERTGEVAGEDYLVAGARAQASGRFKGEFAGFCAEAGLVAQWLRLVSAQELHCLSVVEGGGEQGGIEGGDEGRLSGWDQAVAIDREEIQQLRDSSVEGKGSGVVRAVPVQILNGGGDPDLVLGSGDHYAGEGEEAHRVGCVVVGGFGNLFQDLAVQLDFEVVAVDRSGIQGFGEGDGDLLQIDGDVGGSGGR